MLQKTSVETDQTRIKWLMLKLRIIDITFFVSLILGVSVSIYSQRLSSYISAHSN